MAPPRARFGGRAHDPAAMETRKASETRKQTHAQWEYAGTVDGPFDRDRPEGQDPLHTDAACSVPWLADGFEAISVFVDPVLVDRAPGICETMNALGEQHRDIESLSEAVQTFARGEGLSAAIHERPRDELTAGVVAVSYTLG
jgi:hypothetical protein